MANPEHVEILLDGGVEKWNAFIKQQGFVVLEKRSRMNYSEAKPSRADLRWADLSWANLGSVILRETNLVGSEFTRSQVGKTAIINCDLTRAVGLETIRHEAPTSLAIDTMYKSQGKIPEVFLRGAGVPETLVQYIPSLVGEPWEYYSCFISYLSKDQDIADRLHADLQKNGVRCWLANEILKIGHKFRTEIDKAIKVYDKLLIILSDKSIASPWVEDEVESTIEKEGKKKGQTVLFAIKVDNSIHETDEAWANSIRRKRHIGNFTN